MPVLVKASLFLFVAAEAFILLALGPSALPLVGAWALAGVVVATVARRVRWPLARVILAAVLMVGCVVLAAEEGLFFVPAAAALFAAAVSSRHHGHAVHVGR